MAKLLQSFLFVTIFMSFFSGYMGSSEYTCTVNLDYQCIEELPNACVSTCAYFVKGRRLYETYCRRVGGTRGKTYTYCHCVFECPHATLAPTSN
ncbi:hypothetical protein ABFX02_02G044800 [Erythranthe guttata]